MRITLVKDEKKIVYVNLKAPREQLIRSAKDLDSLVPEPVRHENSEKRSAKLLSVETDLTAINRALELGDETGAEQAFYESGMNAGRVEVQTKELSQHLIDKRIEPHDLLEQIEKVAQSDMVERVCGHVEDTSLKREGIFYRSKKAPWFLQGREAIRERFCSATYQSE